MVKKKVFHSMKEINKQYFPKWSKKHPITMQVSKEEQDLIFRERRSFMWR